MAPDVSLEPSPAPREGPSDETLPHARPVPPRPPLGDDCWFLTGPTASGKTAIGVRMAERLGAEIVSVDSMAVYRGLDIGTAKPGRAERDRVPHHLVDVIDAAGSYNVALWLADVGEALRGIRGRGRRILFVGGTPLYLRALRDGLADLPAADPTLRGLLHAEAERCGTVVLHRRLAAADPQAARRIHPHDLKRIVRALEVAETTGTPLSAAFAPRPDPLFARRTMVVDLPRALLRERIERRVEAMFAAGLVEETRAVLAGRGIGPTAAQAAGYAEALAVIEGRLSLGEAILRTKARTRQLAKRQLTWLRGFHGAVWIAA